MLNVNELANALKPAVLPGESLRVKVIREGKEAEQGVGYLDDGTMIVIEGGRRLLGDTVDVEVTSVLQSPSGKMIFTPARRMSGARDLGRSSSPPARASGSAADRPKAFVQFGERTLLAASPRDVRGARRHRRHRRRGARRAGRSDMSLLADDLCAGKIAAAVPGGAIAGRVGGERAGRACPTPRTSCWCTTPPARWSTRR